MQWLVFSFLLMLCYELYWLRYFRSEKTMADFYSSFLGVPVAVLGVGHIGIHLMHRKESLAG